LCEIISLQYGKLPAGTYSAAKRYIDYHIHYMPRRHWEEFRNVNG
jgi:hypothetical protein